MLKLELKFFYVNLHMLETCKMHIHAQKSQSRLNPFVELLVRLDRSYMAQQRTSVRLNNLSSQAIL